MTRLTILGITAAILLGTLEAAYRIVIGDRISDRTSATSRCYCARDGRASANLRTTA